MTSNDEWLITQSRRVVDEIQFGRTRDVGQPFNIVHAFGHTAIERGKAIAGLLNAEELAVAVDKAVAEAEAENKRLREGLEAAERVIAPFARQSGRAAWTFHYRDIQAAADWLSRHATGQRDVVPNHFDVGRGDEVLDRAKRMPTTGQQKGVNTSDDECGGHSPVSVQDPMVLLEMLLQFGKSPDGAVESDLRRAIIALKARAEVANKAVAAERERCAKIAERGHCTYSGCDPQTTGHSNLCPIGIAEAIRGDSPSNGDTWAFRHGKAYILAQLENPDEALVEAVAKAIYEADPEGGYYEDDPSSYWMAEGFSEHVWTIWRATAREAIRALARTLAEGEENDG